MRGLINKQIDAAHHPANATRFVPGASVFEPFAMEPGNVLCVAQQRGGTHAPVAPTLVKAHAAPLFAVARLSRESDLIWSVAWGEPCS